LSRASILVDQIRADLQPVVTQLLNHPYLATLESGQLSREWLRPFAGEQHAIIRSDLRSVAHLASRFGDDQSGAFFLAVLDGERSALAALADFAAAVGLSGAELTGCEPQPGAHAYTLYMAWLAFYGSAAEVAAAYLVNFPAWGESCGRLSRLLKERLGFDQAAVRFFDQFAAPAPEFESTTLTIIETGLERGVSPEAIHRAARLLQAYELMYWNELYAALQRDT
jgi:thiaminase